MPPADGSGRAISPIDRAVNMQPTSAITTPRTSEPPANSAPTAIENAAAEAGAVVVTDVKTTAGSPIALRRSGADWGTSVTCSALLIATPGAHAPASRALMTRRSAIQTFSKLRGNKALEQRQ